MDQRSPRVAAVHDLSCVGRCSLTVIIPTLFSMGVEVCPLPTAVLSSHFGGFKDVAVADFTANMPRFAAHWQREQLSFDCIYSGFLANEQQIEIVSRFIDEFSHTKPFVLVDPVMGDEGKLYSMFTPKLQQRMQKLVQKADLITPNYTEACLLLGKRYEAVADNPEEIKQWLVDLAELGPRQVVITGIPLNGGKLLNAAFEREKGCMWHTISERIPATYPGTGDIFASVLAGALLAGKNLYEAIAQATAFVEQAIKVSFAAGTPVREGVLLERVLPWLCRQQ